MFSSGLSYEKWRASSQKRTCMLSCITARSIPGGEMTLVEQLAAFVVRASYEECHWRHVIN